MKILNAGGANDRLCGERLIHVSARLSGESQLVSFGPSRSVKVSAVDIKPTVGRQPSCRLRAGGDLDDLQTVPNGPIDRRIHECCLKPFEHPVFPKCTGFAT